jgi:hypothetical protein
MRRSVRAAMLGAMLLLGGASCQNDAATAKCSTSRECAACCTRNGATGNASGTVNGVYGCKCLGGG